MNKKVFGRHGARWVALQSLYAWLINGGKLEPIEKDLLKMDESFKISFDKDFLNEILIGIYQKSDEINQQITPHLDRKLTDITPIEQSILWIGMYELMERPETPYKVILNEAIELAKLFGAQDSHKFINGILDKAAKTLRADEIKSFSKHD